LAGSRKAEPGSQAKGVLKFFNVELEIHLEVVAIFPRLRVWKNGKWMPGMLRHDWRNAEVTAEEALVEGRLWVHVP
jgi:hypothetical protein